MRFMVMVKATSESEAGQMPSEEMLSAMAKYNEELIKAGVMLAGEGLHPSSRGAKVRFSGTKRTVIDGPFSETKELVAGYWILQTKDLAECIEWVKRCPNPMNSESDIEIRYAGDGTTRVRRGGDDLTDPDHPDPVVVGAVGVHELVLTVAPAFDATGRAVLRATASIIQDVEGAQTPHVVVDELPFMPLSDLVGAGQGCVPSGLYLSVAGAGSAG